jgi:hypothetical protein
VLRTPERLEGEPLAFGQLSLELLAASAPDRSWQPVARISDRPHTARPRQRSPASVLPDCDEQELRCSQTAW